uniref:ATP synthase complex subunit 8 n=1 Tax=Daphnia magna TaxID=35525 RepID=A0A386PYT6_9CRUS|nr:ATP synthase F0 subunit 8 [Daphnia magna]
MPQIWPMNWILLYLAFILIFLFFISLMYFVSFGVQLTQEEKSSENLNTFSCDWKW